MGSAAARWSVPLLVVGIILMMVVPLPPMLLDSILALNITLAVLVILAVVLIEDTLELSAFPSILLVATVFRLALNVSSTRLILLDGYAGKVIQAFGDFVVGGSIVVGLVVFLILIVIQFAVITAGAGRVAEVGARFALDAMPGKQMAIDADLASGLINDVEAKERRKRIAKESDFYGAMDGASKFVKGDAIAGVIIVIINLVGGFAIGVASQGLSLSESISKYTLLTVGDGLVSQLPALLISVATGLLVSRVGDEDSDLGPLLGKQLFANKLATRISSMVIAGLGLMPGLPIVPFFAIAGVLFYVSSRPAPVVELDEGQSLSIDDPGPDDPETIISNLRIEPLELHLAYDALDLIDTNRGGDLLERVRALRHQIAQELGVVMPLVRTRDEAVLPPGSYRILLHGVEIARGDAPAGRLLALPAGDGSELRSIAVEETVEPVFKLPAFWIPTESRTAAAATGATVVDRSSVVVTHLAEVVRDHAPDLLSRQQVQQLVDGLRYDEPLLANEIGSEQLSLGLLHQVLRGLLDERVAIRDLGRIVEVLSHKVRETQNVAQLVAAARVPLGPGIVAKMSPDRRIGAITLAPELEASFHESLRDVDGTLHLVLSPPQLQALSEGVQRPLSGDAARGRTPMLVCGQLLRQPLQRTLGSLGVDLSVLSYPELPDTIDLVQIGVIGHATAAA
jgi:flagellar biosynthesis protein FlhA